MKNSNQMYILNLWLEGTTFYLQKNSINNSIDLFNGYKKIHEFNDINQVSKQNILSIIWEKENNGELFFINSFLVQKFGYVSLFTHDGLLLKNNGTKKERLFQWNEIFQISKNITDINTFFQNKLI